METYFKLTQEGMADERVEAMYSDIKTKFNVTFIPDFFKALAFHESLFAGIWDGYQKLLVEGTIPKNIKEMIFLTIAIHKGCNYCSSTHLAVCNMLEVSNDNLSSILKNVEDVNPRRVRLILEFSLSLISNPRSIADETYDDLKAEGITEEEIVDIIGITILSNTAVNMAQSMGLSVEEEIQEYLDQEDLQTGLRPKIAA
ncbi:hypothetical protein A9Q84_19005 [Halobacteriovorax marinus]|mgnify:CR=1 FL=1|uniref:Carboxymuconolactone decarboxylase-like domain-containing protein n=1 Tax=Halobacteriovorax marinus TaxID=97084 RepID=A0A1Y5F838_9BACT|nr:hypothetical protein A9Q84_19005 [Halobacteriovorax marinus]